MCWCLEESVRRSAQVCQRDTLSIHSLQLLSPDPDTSSLSLKRLIEARDMADTSYLVVSVPKVSPQVPEGVPLLQG